MADVSVDRRLSDVSQGESSRNRCVAGLAVSVARNRAVTLDAARGEGRRPSDDRPKLAAHEGCVGIGDAALWALG